MTYFASPVSGSTVTNPEDIEVTVDPETGEAKYVISVDDPTLAEETQKALKDDDFVQNVNRAIGENAENLPERIREVLEIQDVNPDEEIVREERDVNFFCLSKKKQIKIENPIFLILLEIPTKNNIVFHHISQSPTKFMK